MCLKEGTYHTRLFRGPITNVMKREKREEASEKKRVEASCGQGQYWGEVGDGSRKVLPWTANP